MTNQAHAERDTRARETVTTWQPIETAPHDEIIVVQLEDGWCGRAVWEDGEEGFLAFDDDAQRFESEPVAWIYPAHRYREVSNG